MQSLRLSPVQSSKERTDLFTVNPVKASTNISFDRFINVVQNFEMRATFASLNPTFRNYYNE
jgi:hypothetical protein